MNGKYRLGETVLGDWILTRIIGEGSYGRVFEAERIGHSGDIQKSAIKIITIPKNESEHRDIRKKYISEGRVAEYFQGVVEKVSHEAALMSKLNGNANIVNYKDYREIAHDSVFGWDIIIRMELLTPLLNYLAQHRISRQTVIQIGIDMCRAIELCQNYHIVHRDIKPENIFVSESGEFKLGDFGIAHIADRTIHATKICTNFYLAPEIHRGEPYNPSVDTYSLGIILYRFLNDYRIPFLPDFPENFAHRDEENAFADILAGERIPNPKHADGRLAEIVLKACAYDKKERYSSPVQMRQELEAVQRVEINRTIIFPPVVVVEAKKEPPVFDKPIRTSLFVPPQREEAPLPPIAPPQREEVPMPPIAPPQREEVPLPPIAPPQREEAPLPPIAPPQWEEAPLPPIASPQQEEALLPPIASPQREEALLPPITPPQRKKAPLPPVAKPQRKKALLPPIAPPQREETTQISAVPNEKRGKASIIAAVYIAAVIVVLVLVVVLSSSRYNKDNTQNIAGNPEYQDNTDSNTQPSYTISSDSENNTSDADAEQSDTKQELSPNRDYLADGSWLEAVRNASDFVTLITHFNEDGSIDYEMEIESGILKYHTLANEKEIFISVSNNVNRSRAQHGYTDDRLALSTDTGWSWDIIGIHRGGMFFFIDKKIYFLDPGWSDEVRGYLVQKATSELGEWNNFEFGIDNWINILFETNVPLGQVCLATGADGRDYVVVHRGKHNENPDDVWVVPATKRFLINH